MKGTKGRPEQRRSYGNTFGSQKWTKKFVQNLKSASLDKLKIDFYDPLPTGQYILVILDCYSRFPEVEVLSSISAKTVIPKLDAVFARHGVPSQVVSDNGPHVQGHEFNRYMTKMGIQHNTSTPLWPQGNAELKRS